MVIRRSECLSEARSGAGGTHGSRPGAEDLKGFPGHIRIPPRKRNLKEYCGIQLIGIRLGGKGVLHLLPGSSGFQKGDVALDCVFQEKVVGRGFPQDRQESVRLFPIFGFQSLLPCEGHHFILGRKLFQRRLDRRSGVIRPFELCLDAGESEKIFLFGEIAFDHLGQDLVGGLLVAALGECLREPLPGVRCGRVNLDKAFPLGDRAIGFPL